MQGELPSERPCTADCKIAAGSAHSPFDAGRARLRLRFLAHRSTHRHRGAPWHLTVSRAKIERCPRGLPRSRCERVRPRHSQTRNRRFACCSEKRRAPACPHQHLRRRARRVRTPRRRPSSKYRSATRRLFVVSSASATPRSASSSSRWECSSLIAVRSSLLADVLPTPDD